LSPVEVANEGRSSFPLAFSVFNMKLI
jgi:hypothetical protein